MSTNHQPIKIQISDEFMRPVSRPVNDHPPIKLQYLKKDGTPILMGKVVSSQKDYQEIGVITCPIRLPSLGYYQIEIEASANNNRTYFYLSNLISPQTNLLREKVYLKKANTDPILYKFRAKLKHPEVQIGLLIGDDSIILPSDHIIIQSITLYPEAHTIPTTVAFPTQPPSPSQLQSSPQPPSQLQSSPSPSPPSQPSEFVIRRVVDNLEDLTSESVVAPGEHVILKAKEEGDPDHLYIQNGQTKCLEYVCRIGQARPHGGLLSLSNQVGQILPIYGSRQEAKEKLGELGVEKFYRPPAGQDYHYSSAVGNDIYMYLDPKGYVRWIRK